MEQWKPTNGIIRKYKQVFRDTTMECNCLTNILVICISIFLFLLVFPAHYAQSRRIACDAWNKMKDTEYTLNALSYGWWQDKVYQFNDPDHIVLRDATDGENRARVTSGLSLEFSLLEMISAKAVLKR